MAVTNSSGAVTATYTYDEYGRPNSWSGSRFRYTGQTMPPAAQLYHYKARARMIHLRVLRSAGLVVQNLRGREKWYSIDQPTVEQARACLTALAANDSTASEHGERG